MEFILGIVVRGLGIVAFGSLYLSLAKRLKGVV